MEHNDQSYRVTVILRSRLFDAVRQASSAREQTVSEYVRETLRQRTAVDVGQHDPQAERP